MSRDFSAKNSQKWLFREKSRKVERREEFFTAIFRDFSRRARDFEALCREFFVIFYFFFARAKIGFWSRVLLYC